MLLEWQTFTFTGLFSVSLTVRAPCVQNRDETRVRYIGTKRGSSRFEAFLFGIVGILNVKLASSDQPVVNCRKLLLAVVLTPNSLTALTPSICWMLQEA